MRPHVSQRCKSAGEGVDMSELQAHQCITPEQWSWILCSVSAIPVNKVLLQESNQLIEIKMLTSDFLKFFNSYSQFPGSQMPVSPPPADAHESSPPYLFENHNVLEKFQVIWQP